MKENLAILIAIKLLISSNNLILIKNKV